MTQPTLLWEDNIIKSTGIISFEEIVEVEHKRIKTRRQKAGLPEGDPKKDSIGLALSGGGVRSATYNLGLLQAMNYYNFFPKVDYLSTVSGGGYIGSSLTWFMSRLGTDFPFLTNCEDKSAARMLCWLRRHSSYLVPGQGLGLAALIAAVLRGMFINLLIFLPLLVAIVYCLASHFPMSFGLTEIWPYQDFFPLIFVLGSSLTGTLLAAFLCYALLSARVRQYDFSQRRKVQVWLGRLLIIATTLMVLGSSPLAYVWLKVSLPEWWKEAVSSITFTGILSFITGWLRRSQEDETHGKIAWMLRIGLFLLLFSLFLWLYHYAVYLHSQTAIVIWGVSFSPGLFVVCCLLISLLTGMMSNVNLVSMHRYYRDRLLETYMPEFQETGSKPTFRNADKCYLKDIQQTSAPYHIINTNIVTVGSSEPKYRARGGDNFIFSPEYVGSEATGYIGTSEYEFGETNLATALAISGAAVNPNTGSTRSRPLAFIMSLLNVRLGYWMRNPNRPRLLNTLERRFFSRPFWHLYVFREMFGWGMDEKNRYLHLSDGGHFENLGLYELVRRRCRYIIIADAGADPQWTYGDLAKACERIRADFCALMVINTQPLHPEEESRLSHRPSTIGKIYYEDGGESTVLFLKTTVFPNLPEDIYGYKRVHPSFPDQTTADQFFDESQFEAYRELGYGTGRYAFENKTFDEIFKEEEKIPNPAELDKYLGCMAR